MRYNYSCRIPLPTLIHGKPVTKISTRIVQMFFRYNVTCYRSSDLILTSGVVQMFGLKPQLTNFSPVGAL